MLYVKTQNFHWNLVDPRFFSLHKFFEEHYEQLADSVDELAERIRMIGGIAPGSMRQFLKMASLQESDSCLSGDQMIQHLNADHQTMINLIKPLIEEIVKLGDEGTGDLLVQQLRMHEQMAWMLKAHLTQAG